MTNHPFRFLCLLLGIFALVSLFPDRASADAASEKFIKDRHAELVGALRANDNAKVDQIFDEMIDYQAIASDSLGEAWKDLKDAEKAQFVCILRGLVSDAYRRDLKRTLDYDVSLQGSNEVERGQLVKTVATSKSNQREEPIRVDYVVYKNSEKMKVRDILTEGSSLVGNYNSQFRRIIKKKGFEGLIEKMEKKLGDRAKACRP